MTYQGRCARRVLIFLIAILVVSTCQSGLYGEEFEFVTAETWNSTPIPLWEWVSSDIRVKSAPPGAVVHHMDVYYEVSHSCVGDIEIDLTNQMANISHDLYGPVIDFSCQFDRAVWETDITTFAGYPVNRVWSLYAIDWLPREDGDIDRWRIKIYYTIPPAPANDHIDAAVLVQEDKAFHGTSLGATGELEGETGWLDTHDVWHLYYPDETGLALFSLEGSNFDTSLTVYDFSGQIVRATNDDVQSACEETPLWSALSLPVQAGERYQVRVAGLAEAMGDYTLRIALDGSELPEAPRQGVPLPNRELPAHQVTLAWNGRQNQLKEAPRLQAAPLLGQKPKQRLKTIYGRDDRVDEYSITDPDIIAAGAATAMLLPRVSLQDNSDGSFNLPEETFAQWHEDMATENYMPSLCGSEAFQDQPNPAECSCFLVAPDIIVSAGHCVSCISDSNDTAVVFDFVMMDAKTPRLTIDSADIYYCKEVIAQSNGKPDWAIIRLDRPVLDRQPLPIRRSGKIAYGQSLLNVGHPLGLPRKYDLGGSVRDNNDVREFQASVDAFQGSSGSPVLNLDTMEVEGILVSGNRDFTWDYQHGIICMRANRCSEEEGCPQWASVSRITAFSLLIPSYDVHLGTDPQQLEPVASYLVSPMWKPKGLKPGSTYFWQVTARNHAGEVAGPVWTFKTLP
jgi:V8-like Glu-specific endopeptidase